MESIIATGINKPNGHWGSSPLAKRQSLKIFDQDLKIENMFSHFRTIWLTFLHMFSKRATIEYPEEKVPLYPRWRGRIVDCIALQATEDENGRRYPEFFRINFSRCIYCGFCEEACPTYAIQLIPDFEMAEYNRQNLVFEKEDLSIKSQGKYPGYNFYKVAGMDAGVKEKGHGENEDAPVDIHSLLP